MKKMKQYDFMKKAIAARAQDHALRRLRDLVPLPGPFVQAGEKKLLNFSSNDYLGLSQHSDIISRSIEFTKKYGAGATASRLICGNLSPDLLVGNSETIAHKFSLFQLARSRLSPVARDGRVKGVTPHD